MIGSLADLAARAGMPSDVTLRKLIRRHPDFPILSAGRHGRAYEIDLEEAERFILGLREKATATEAERQKAIRELGLTISATNHVNQEKDRS